MPRRDPHVDGARVRAGRLKIVAALLQMTATAAWFTVDSRMVADHLGALGPPAPVSLLGSVLVGSILGLTVLGVLESVWRAAHSGEPWWHSWMIPALSTGALAALLVLVVRRLAELLALPASSPLGWGVPTGYLLVVGIGYGFRVLPRARTGVHPIGGGGRVGARRRALVPRLRRTSRQWGWSPFPRRPYLQPFASLEPRIPISPDPGRER
jgi:hypothetical protein